MIIGILVVCVAGWLMMPKMMLNEHESPFGVEETMEKITASALAEGWVVSSVTRLHQSVKKHNGHGFVPRLAGQPVPGDHAYKISGTDGVIF